MLAGLGERARDLGLRGGDAVTQVPLVAEVPRARAAPRAELDREGYVALGGVDVDHRDGSGV